jgi:hypothetical protein
VKSPSTVGSHGSGRPPGTNSSLCTKPAALQPSGQQPGAHLTPNDDDYMPVINKKSRRRIVVIGGRNNTAFHGVEKKAVLCVNRLSLDTQVEAVVGHLESNNIRVFSCFAVMKRATSDNADEMEVNDVGTRPPRFCSMRLCVSQSAVSDVLSPELWPRGVTVRHWTFKNRPTADRQS